MVAGTLPRPRVPRRREATAAGYSFLEILVVMALMGILMGVGLGVLTNVGQGSKTQQAQAILRETAFACMQSSNGGTRAILDLREREADGTLVIGAAISDPVLTHNFESLDFVSRDYPIDIDGKVESVAEGYTGRAARFERGGLLRFAPQSAFAMTEGLMLTLWVRPEPGPTTMTLVKGEGAYEVQLVQQPGGEGYNVRLQLHLKNATDDRAVGLPETFETKGGPVRVDGKTWTHLRVAFDGAEPSIRVNGVEMVRSTKRRSAGDDESGAAPRQKRIAIPEGGAVALTISDGISSYVGLMDSLVLGGVFRSDETERELSGLRLIRPRSPVRVVYRNGRLDPDEHAGDVVILLENTADPEGPQLEVRLGLYGTVEHRLIWGGAEETGR